MSTTNPFPGLRPFREDENHLFFGREEQTAELLRRLRQSRFIAVVGTSGSGKSSLVRAGLLPALHGGTMSQAGSSWEVATSKPGGDPIANLARALIDADLYDSDDGESLPQLTATLTRSRNGLIEAVRQARLASSTNLLVVVDQFEELFRFRQLGAESEEAAAAFVKLLLTATTQDEHPIYVVITMRSDYLGDCAQIAGLPEAVNRGEYLIPQLKRDQRRAAIERPVKVGGATIAPRLVQQLLNDVGDNQDQLPILQHALMRTWDHWLTRRAAGASASDPIDLDHYEATGGMQEALSRHADEVFEELPSDAHRALAERLFKTLTVRGSDNRGIRRPTRLKDLCAILASNPFEIETVINAYRAPGITFLMPTTEVALTPESVIDISHESLMRVWQRLHGWVEEESQSARIYRRLTESARLYADGKAGLYHDPDLHIALAWHAKNQPNEAWAAQYGAGLELALDFLDRSRTDAERAEKEREAARQRELQQARALAEAQKQRADEQARSVQRGRRFAAALSVLLVIALVAVVVAFAARSRSQEDARRAEAARATAEKAEAAAATANRGLAATVAELDEQRAAELFEKNLSHQGLAYYARMLRENPTDTRLANYVISILSDRSFPLPAAPPITGTGSSGDDSLHFSKDHTRLAVRGAQQIDVYDITTGARRLAAVPAPGVRNSDGGTWNFSPSGKRVAVLSAGTIKVFSADTGESVGTPLQTSRLQDRETGIVTRLVFNHDDSLLALLAGATSDKPIQVWDLASGTLAHSIATSADMLVGFEFLPSSPRILTYSVAKGVLQLWHAVTGELMSEFGGGQLESSGYGVSRYGFSLSADGRFVAAFDDAASVVKTWNLETREEAGPAVTCSLPRGTSTGTRPFSLSAEGDRLLLLDLIAGATRATAVVSLWDVKTGKRIGSVDAGEVSGRVNLAFLPDGEHASFGARGAGSFVYSILTRRRTTEPVLDIDGWNVHFSQTRLVGAVGGDRLHLLDIRPRQAYPEIWQFGAGDRPLSRFDIRLFSSPAHRDAGILTVATNGAIMARDWETGEPRTPPLVLDASARLDAQPAAQAGPWSRSPRYFNVALTRMAVATNSTSTNRELAIWDLSQGAKLSTCALSNIVDSVVFSPDAQHVLVSTVDRRGWSSASSTVTRLTMFQVANGQSVWSLSHSNAARPFPTIVFSPDGRTVNLTASRNRIEVLDAATGNSIRVIEAHQNHVYGIEFHEPTQTVLTHSFDRTVRLWQYPSWEPKGLPLVHDGAAARIALSTDGRNLAVAELQTGAVRVWDLEKRILRFAPIRRGYPRSLQFSADGRRLMLAQTTGFLLLDAYSGRPISSINNNSLNLDVLRLSPDGRRVTGFGNPIPIGPEQAYSTTYRWTISDVEQPAPAWFLDLIEAVAGRAVTEARSIQEVPMEKFFEVAQRIQSSSDADTYTRWAKWFLADPDSRPIGPFQNMTRQEFIHHQLASDSTAAWTDILELDPNNALALAKLGNQFAQGSATNADSQQPLRFTTRATRLAPQTPEVWKHHASVLAGTGAYQQAHDALSRYHQMAAADRQTLLLQGQIEERLGRLEAAEQLYTRSLEQPDLQAAPQNDILSNPLDQRRRVRVKLGNLEGASADFAAASRIPPRSSDVPSNLLDLSRHFNEWFLPEDTITSRILRRRDKQQLLRSELDQTQFELRAIVSLRSRKAAETSRRFEESRVDGITVGQKCRSIRFLHALSDDPGAKFRDREVGQYVLHYADKSRQTVSIREGRDVWREIAPEAFLEQTARPAIGLRARLATDENVPNPFPFVQAYYQTQIDVAHTDKVIESIELTVNAELPVGLNVFAITIE